MNAFMRLDLSDGTTRTYPDPRDEFAPSAWIASSGRWVVVGTGRSLYRAPIAGGAVERVFDIPGTGRGYLPVAIDRQERILYADGNLGIYRLPITGGVPLRIVPPIDAAAVDAGPATNPFKAISILGDTLYFGVGTAPFIGVVELPP